MKRTFFILFASMLLIAPVGAQETYESAKIAKQDLNGTARYVGMGGAMEALGADISTIGTNPAGIGLFRHSTGSLSFGLVSQQDAKNFSDANKSNMSFDQLGFVYVTHSNDNSFLNFAFNYHKSANFDYILSASSALNNASQNKQSYIKGALGSMSAGGFNIGKNSNGRYIGYESNTSSKTARSFNQLDYLYWNALLVDPNTHDYGYNAANGYLFNREHSGYIGDYDFNMSANIHDRVYLGLTLGLHDVHYKGYSEYVEHLVGSGGTPVGDVIIADERTITGAGFDFKAGLIFRPIEASPFRIGLSVATPIWYDLTTKNYTTLFNKTTGVGAYDRGDSNESYDFRLNTPWKFGASIGHTIDKYLALGATFEYTDYAYLDNRYKDGGYYDAYFDTYYDSSSSDEVMNRHTKRTLKGVSTVRLGMEVRPTQPLALRLGYNYVSPMYSKSGYKDGSLNSEGSYYSSASDYTNWKATQRFTCGLGYTVEKLSLDLAYQYSTTNGDFYPFTNGMSASVTDGGGHTTLETNNVNPFSVSNKRHQVLFTVGYRF